MQCHCTEIETLRVENDTLAELLRGATEDRARWEQKALSTFDSLTQAMADKQVAEHKLEQIAALHRNAGQPWGGYCYHDGESWPCDTAVILDA